MTATVAAEHRAAEWQRLGIEDLPEPPDTPAQRKRSRTALLSWRKYTYTPVTHLGERAVRVTSPEGQDYYVTATACTCPSWEFHCSQDYSRCKHQEMVLIWETERLAWMHEPLPCVVCPGELKFEVRDVPGRGLLMLWVCQSCGRERAH